MKTLPFLLSALTMICLLSCTNDLSENLDEESIIETNAMKTKPNEGLDNVAGNPKLAKEISQLRTLLANIRTLEQADEAGWNFDLTGYVSGMGYHYVNQGYIDDGEFELTKPEALLIACSGSKDSVVVGVEYIVPISEKYDVNTPPEGFSGDSDVWGIVGPFWTLHAWIKTPNPDGFFNPTNSRIPDSDLCIE